MKIQEMTRELFQRLGKVRDEMLRDEHQIEQILLADRITLDYKVSSQHFDDMVRKHNLNNDAHLVQEMERSSCPGDLAVRIVDATNLMIE